METSRSPLQAGAAGQPVKRVVVTRPAAEPRVRRPRMAKRLFLVFCIVFFGVVIFFIIGGN